MNNGDAALLTQQHAATRIDEETLSRFATCCRALGITVYQRQRPADLAAARTGFTALTRVAHDQCDTWTGLAAAGDLSARVLAAVSETAATAGARFIRAWPGCPRARQPAEPPCPRGRAP